MTEMNTREGLERALKNCHSFLQSILAEKCPMLVAEMEKLKDSQIELVICALEKLVPYSREDRLDEYMELLLGSHQLSKEEFTAEQYEKFKRFLELFCQLIQ